MEDCGAHIQYVDGDGHETVVICSLVEHSPLIDHYDFRLRIAWRTYEADLTPVMS